MDKIIQELMVKQKKIKFLRKEKNSFSELQKLLDEVETEKMVEKALKRVKEIEEYQEV